MDNKKLFIIAAAAFGLFIFLTVVVNSKMNNTIRATESTVVSPVAVKPANAVVTVTERQNFSREIAAEENINAAVSSPVKPVKTISEMKDVVYERPSRDVILPE